MSVFTASSGPARSCAPYTVFVDDAPEGRAPTLVALYRLVSDLRHRLAQECALQAAQARFDLMFAQAGRIRVMDARGTLRPELSSPHALLMAFGCRLAQLHRMVDHGWDGDLRPRGVPIPHTGAPCRYGVRYFRRPRTQSQRRHAFAIQEEGEPGFRGARRARSLPTAWDDLPRNGAGERSWKNFRRTQWKG